MGLLEDSIPLNAEIKGKLRGLNANQVLVDDIYNKWLSPSGLDDGDIYDKNPSPGEPMIMTFVINKDDLPDKQLSPVSIDRAIRDRTQETLIKYDWEVGKDAWEARKEERESPPEKVEEEIQVESYSDFLRREARLGHRMAFDSEVRQTPTGRIKQYPRGLRDSLEIARCSRCGCRIIVEEGTAGRVVGTNTIAMSSEKMENLTRCPRCGEHDRIMKYGSRDAEGRCAACGTHYLRDMAAETNIRNASNKTDIVLRTGYFLRDCVKCGKRNTIEWKREHDPHRVVCKSIWD